MVISPDLEILLRLFDAGTCSEEYLAEELSMLGPTRYNRPCHFGEDGGACFRSACYNCELIPDDEPG